MKAVVMTAAGGPEVLKLEERPVPELPDESHLLVRVRAAGVNPIDAKVRKLNLYYPESTGAVLGCDGAGIVERAGSACMRFKPGDEVYFFNGGIGGPIQGTYAEYAVVYEDYAARMPKNLSMLQAAAVPLVLITAWEALVFRGGIESGQKVLVHAGAGGVGHVAIQLAKHLRTRVATTVSTDAKARFVQSLGAELTIDYRTKDFVEAVSAWTGEEGVDVVLDTVGGDTFLKSLDATRIYGRVITVVGTPLDMAHVNKARRRNLIIGYEGMTAPMHMGNHRARLAQSRILEQGARLIEQGKLTVHTSEVLPLADAAKAHAMIEQGHTQGKIVLVVD